MFAVTTLAQSNGLGERFSAVAMDLDRGKTVQLQIAVDRWTSDAQSARLVAALPADKGPGTLLNVLQDLPAVGFIRNTSSLAWDLHYARRTAGEDGGEHIVLITDRPVSFWEEANDSRTLDYPFTVVDLQLNKDGEGKGTLSAAAKITRGKDGEISLENLGTQPIRLEQVKTDKATQ